jgi:hypothetical protein
VQRPDVSQRGKADGEIGKSETSGKGRQASLFRPRPQPVPCADGLGDD